MTKTTADKPDSLEKLLESIETALDQAKDEKTTAESVLDVSKTRLATATGFAADVEKLTSEYERAYKGLVAQHDADGEYLRNEKRCLEEILGTETQTVQRTVETLYQEVHDARGEVHDAKDDLKAKTTDLDTAQEERDKAKASADRWQRLLATFSARFKALDGVKGEVKTAHEATKYAVAYWLLALPTYEPEDSPTEDPLPSLGRFEKMLTDPPRVVSPAELPAKLLEQAVALDEAERVLGAASLAVELQKEKLAEAEADLADKEKNLDTRIREALENIKPEANPPGATAHVAPSNATADDEVPKNGPDTETTADTPPTSE